MKSYLEGGVQKFFVETLLNRSARRVSCASMRPKKRKISDLTAGDADTLLLALNEFQGILDEDDDELPRGLITALGDLRSKLEVVVKVCMS